MKPFPYRLMSMPGPNVERSSMSGSTRKQRCRPSLRVACVHVAGTSRPLQTNSQSANPSAACPLPAASMSITTTCAAGMPPRRESALQGIRQIASGSVLPSLKPWSGFGDLSGLQGKTLQPSAAQARAASMMLSMFTFRARPRGSLEHESGSPRTIGRRQGRILLRVLRAKWNSQTWRGHVQNARRTQPG